MCFKWERSKDCKVVGIAAWGWGWSSWDRFVILPYCLASFPWKHLPRAAEVISQIAPTVGSAPSSNVLRVGGFSPQCHQFSGHQLGVPEFNSTLTLSIQRRRQIPQDKSSVSQDHALPQTQIASRGCYLYF